MTNLAAWKGKFKTGLDYRFKSLEQALSTGDSAQVVGRYNSISSSYFDLGMPDSAAFFGRAGTEWSAEWQTLNYWLLLVRIDYRNDTIARPQFTNSLNKFRSIVPQEMWELADILADIFDGYARTDSAAAAAAYERLVDSTTQGNSSGNRREYGELLVLTGQYAKAKETLKQIISGENETANGFTYIVSVYLLGRAEEGLGNTREAIEKYQEVLRYWGDPEIEIQEIKDTRERLARLLS
jgi:tetratricopeptide (TPR) repeat protein